MAFAERRECLGVAGSRSRQLQHRLSSARGIYDLGIEMKMRGRQLPAKLSRRLHDAAIVVARSAIATDNRVHRTGPAMLSMASGTGAIFDHVRLVKCVLFVAGLACLIDPLE